LKFGFFFINTRTQIDIEYFTFNFLSIVTFNPTSAKNGKKNRYMQRYFILNVKRVLWLPLFSLLWEMCLNGSLSGKGCRPLVKVNIEVLDGSL